MKTSRIRGHAKPQDVELAVATEASPGVGLEAVEAQPRFGGIMLVGDQDEVISGQIRALPVRSLRGAAREARKGLA